MYSIIGQQALVSASLVSCPCIVRLYLQYAVVVLYGGLPLGQIAAIHVTEVVEHRHAVRIVLKKCNSMDSARLMSSISIHSSASSSNFSCSSERR